MPGPKADGVALIGVIADDLTGASDIAGILARAGARTRLVVGVPPEPAAPGADALVVALKSRSAPVAEAVRDSLAALAWLRAGAAGRRSRPASAMGFVLAGSCSSATLTQVERHRARHPALRIDPAEDPDTAVAGALAFLGRHRDWRPLVYSSAEPEAVAAEQARWGSKALAARLDSLFARVAIAVLADGFGSLVVAGARPRVPLRRRGEPVPTTSEPRSPRGCPAFGPRTGRPSGSF